MKKSLLVIGLLTVLLITGCNNRNEENNVPENQNNQHQEVINNELDKSFEERTSALKELDEILKNPILYGSSNYWAGGDLAKKGIYGIKLKKDDDKYFLEVTTIDAVSFDKAEIDEVVENMSNNDLNTAQLGNYIISKTMPSSLKEHLENEASAIARAILDKYPNDTWLNEKGIPIYIQSIEDDEMVLLLDNVDSEEENRYYMFRIQEAGQDGLYGILDESKPNSTKIELLASDVLNIKEYEYTGFDHILKEDKIITVEKFFNDNSNGTNEVKFEAPALHFDVNSNSISISIYDGVFD